MNKHVRFPISTIIVIACLVAVGLLVGQAQSGGGYDLTWNTLNTSGKTTSAGDGYTLSGSLGQPDVGAELTGGDNTLCGGFWNGVDVHFVHMPFVSHP